ncbi:MAG TPA: Tad domain-containing protein [Azospira sp.]|nr:Tad domain-containing protein [Azospira sp.]
MVILVGFVLIALIGFGGLVIDLGRLYVAKTELQNAADASALAGAKFLDGTTQGVQKAVHGTNNNDTLNGAIYTAGLHRYDFTSKPVTITIANISIGDCPEDACMVPASSVTSNAQAAGKTFLKVDTSATGQQTFNTFLMQVLRIFTPGTEATTQTFGMAVAGRYTIDLAPIGVCAINGTTTADPTTNELLELGYRRGVSYNLMALNAPLGSGPAASDMIWINPIDTPPGTCNPNNSNGNILPGFLCTGTSALNLTTITSNTFVYRNTGLGATPAERALNSRFNVFTGGNSCDVATAPPDRNIKEYTCSGTGAGCDNSATAGLPRDWMDTTAGSNIPTQQSISIDPATNRPVTAPSFAQYGALWSYSRAVHATGSPPKAGATFNLSDWPTLYNGGTVSTSAYPSSITAYAPEQPSGTSYATPYSQVSPSNYFQGPVPNAPGNPNRRILHIAIIDCTVSLGNTACSTLKVLGIGKFFMQVKAQFNGSNQGVWTEFGGLVDPLPPSEIKLYR